MNGGAVEAMAGGFPLFALQLVESDVRAPNINFAIATLAPYADGKKTTVRGTRLLF
jgi:hypothetical protein